MKPTKNHDMFRLLGITVTFTSKLLKLHSNPNQFVPELGVSLWPGLLRVWMIKYPQVRKSPLSLCIGFGLHTVDCSSVPNLLSSPAGNSCWVLNIGDAERSFLPPENVNSCHERWIWAPWLAAPAQDVASEFEHRKMAAQNSVAPR